MDIKTLVFDDSYKEFIPRLSDRDFTRASFFRIQALEISGVSPSEITLYLRSLGDEKRIQLVSYRSRFMFQNDIYILETDGIDDFRFKFRIHFEMKVITRAIGFTVSVYFMLENNK